MRELIREVASRENVSQNELLEQAAEHEVIARGALIAEDLVAAADQLVALTEAAYDALVVSSIAVFAEAEGGPEVLQARQIARQATPSVVSTDMVAVSAFSTGR